MLEARFSTWTFQRCYSDTYHSSTCPISDPSYAHPAPPGLISLGLALSSVEWVEMPLFQPEERMQRQRIDP